MFLSRCSIQNFVFVCFQTDFHYEYTECDSKGGRWRVSVPAPGKCIGGAPNAPIRGKDCCKYTILFLQIDSNERYSGDITKEKSIFDIMIIEV